MKRKRDKFKMFEEEFPEEAKTLALWQQLAAIRDRHQRILWHEKFYVKP